MEERLYDYGKELRLIILKGLREYALCCEFFIAEYCMLININYYQNGSTKSQPIKAFNHMAKQTHLNSRQKEKQSISMKEARIMYDDEYRTISIIVQFYVGYNVSAIIKAEL